MASYESQPRSRAQMRWRLAVALVVGCCLLACAPITMASAKGRAVPDTTSINVGAAVEEAEQAAGSEAPANAQPDAQATAEGQLQAPAAGADAKAGGRRHAAGKAVARARRNAATRGARETTAQSRQAPSGQSTAAVRAKKEKTGGGKKEKSSGKGKKGKTTGGKSKEDPESPGSETDKGTGERSGAAAVAANAASLTPDAANGAQGSSGVGTTGSTESAQVGLSTGPTTSSRSHRRTAVKARGARRRAGASLAAGSVLAAAANVPSSASPPASANDSTSSTGAGRDKGRRPQTGLAPLVTTVTKIVGVVPMALRLLIAALVALALALALRSRLTARRARKLEHQRGQLLEDVGLLQAALLPAPPARIGPVGTSVAYRPAEGPGAGGDFYDVFALEDGQLAVVVGDVSGHGRAALPHTALLRFTIRAYLEAGLSPRRALQTAGSVLERQLGGSFATVVAATYHPRKRTLTYACAGHPPPVVLGSSTLGQTPSIAPVTACSSPPIGAGVRTGMRQTVVAVPGPAHICFYTDGVTEARVGGELYGDTRLARGLRELGSEATAPALLDRVAQETDARPDDMAACVLRVEDGVGEPSILREELELDREETDARRTERFLHACGVESGEASDVVRSARADITQRDPVMLELRFAGGLPAIELRRDNVLHPEALVAARASGAS